MHTPVEMVLEDIGIPVACCPTCEMTNWEFIGAVDVGIYSVSCRTCGRRYELMTRREELMMLARTLARALDVETKQEAAKWFHKLNARWGVHAIVEADHPRMVVTMDGYYPEVLEDDDEF